jgi:hypothetical protein
MMTQKPSASSKQRYILSGYNVVTKKQLTIIILVLFGPVAYLKLRECTKRKPESNPTVKRKTIFVIQI